MALQCPPGLALLLPLLLLLWSCADGEARAFFGLGLFDAVTGSNTSSLVSSLAASHAQHTVSTLGQLADLVQLGQNISLAFFG